MKKEELQMLTDEGIQARVRNKLSLIKNLFSLIKMYYEIEDSQKLLSIIDIITKNLIFSKDALKVMQDLATHTGNPELQNKLKDLDLLFSQCKEFIEERRPSLRKHKSFLFSAKAHEHEDLLESIIKTTI